MKIIDYILENNFNEFFDKYGGYENVSISSFEELDEIGKYKSNYNHIFYKGLVRNGKQDIIYVEYYDEYDESDVYVVNPKDINDKTYIGYITSKNDKINLSETPLT